MTTYLFIDGGHLRRNYAETVRSWFGSEGEIDFGQIKDGSSAAVLPDASTMTHWKMKNGTMKVTPISLHE